MNKLLFLPLLLLVMISCKKESIPSVQSNAQFSIGKIYEDGTISFGGYGDSSSFEMGTHDTYNLINQSIGVDSVVWDFGNGKTSNSTNPVFPSNKAGVYQVTLTVYKNGFKSTASKKVTVYERVLQSIAINNLDINNFLRGQTRFPTFSKVDLWIEVKYSEKYEPLTNNGDVSSPTIYKSPIFNNIDSSFHSSLTHIMPATEKNVISFPVNNGNYPSEGRGTIVNLYAHDNSGTYLLLSSTWFTNGLQFFSNADPFTSKNFTVGIQEPFSSNSISLNCVYKL